MPKRKNIQPSHLFHKPISPSSYNDLHKIVSQSKSIEELPTALYASPKGYAFQKNIQEGQQYSGNQDSLSNNMNPSQFDNSMHKSNNPKFSGYRNNPFPYKGIPIKL